MARRLTHDDLWGVYFAHLKRHVGDQDGALMAVYDAGRFGADAVASPALADRHRQKRARMAVALTSPGAPLARICRVMDIYAHRRQIDRQLLVDRELKRWAVQFRREAMWCARKMPEQPSYPDIGLAFGGWDHTVAIDAFNATEARVKTDARLEAELLWIVREAVGPVQQSAEAA